VDLAPLAGADRRAVDCDVGVLGDVAGRVAHDLAADRHAAAEHELLGGAARGDARVGEELGEAHRAATIRGAMDLDLLQATLASEPAFRARQVWRWTAHGAAGYDEMTDLPAALRARLADAVPFSSLRHVREAHASDGTVKALFHTADERPVEAVLMRYRDGRASVCVSSQSGCPLTCTFCATGSMRFGPQPDGVGDPRPGAALPPHRARRPPRVHGHGRAADEPRRGAGRRRAPARTSASRTGARRVHGRLGPRHPPAHRDDMPIRLALSLHAPEDALRSRIMPINDRYPIGEVLAACEAFYARRRRQVFVEYVMLAGVNDSYAQAVQLATLLDRRVYKLNLIPYNPTGAYDGSSRGAIAAFKAALEEHGLRATVRLTRGRDIEAACGQLAATEITHVV
jgi:23S rRNA (adenine2503-C2)-methyltransferase